jgi:phosphohistidine phosphatase
MKSVIIIRHAKSSWDFSSSDFARPLNERGHHDAPIMADRLLNKNIKIDAFISSPANRALTTAEYFFEAFNPSGDKNAGIIKIPELYHAAGSVFFDVISKVNNEFNTIAIFSHNPGITDFVNKLTNTRIDNMPTCAVFAVNVKTENWKQFQKAAKECWFFDYPKLKN